ncbi:MAG: hypothetical protein QW545_01255 [Thermosphaera sp.]
MKKDVKHGVSLSSTQVSYQADNGLVNLAEEEVKAISSELSEYLSVYSAIEDEKTYSRIISLVNRFLELVAPVSYHPELVQLVSSQIELRLWEVDVPSTLIESLFLNTYRLKHAILAAAESELSTVKRELATVLLDLYARLQAEELFDLVAVLEKSGEVLAASDKLLTLAVLTLVVATNV